MPAGDTCTIWGAYLFLPMLFPKQTLFCIIPSSCHHLVGLLPFLYHTLFLSFTGRGYYSSKELFFYITINPVIAVIYNFRFLWESMFKNSPRNRQNFRDFGFLITDGKSHDRPATFHEAVLTREYGIHMMALGINIRVSIWSFSLRILTPSSPVIVSVAPFW